MVQTLPMTLNLTVSTVPPKTRPRLLSHPAHPTLALTPKRVACMSNECPSCPFYRDNGSC